MKSPIGTMADDVKKRISEEAAQKKFICKNMQEWYYVCALWANRIMDGTSWSSELQTKKRSELLRLVSAKKPQLLRDQLSNMFTREYSKMSSKFQNDLMDGVFLAILDCVFTEEDKQFNGEEAFIMACMDTQHWWKTE